MKEFRIIYRILSILRKSLELEEFDKLLISNESLNITIQEWARLINMLVSNGYVEGIKIINTDSSSYPIVVLLNPTITLKGLEYLEENNMMKKACDLAKGILQCQ